jgi:hypothetical protein
LQPEEERLRSQAILDNHLSITSEQVNGRKAYVTLQRNMPFYAPLSTPALIHINFVCTRGAIVV